MTESGGISACEPFVRRFSVLNFSVFISSDCFRALSSKVIRSSADLTAEDAEKRGAAFGRNQIRATDQTRMKHGLLTGANGENGARTSAATRVKGREKFITQSRKDAKENEEFGELNSLRLCAFA